MAAAVVSGSMTNGYQPIGTAGDRSVDRQLFRGRANAAWQEPQVPLLEVSKVDPGRGYPERAARGSQCQGYLARRQQVRPGQQLGSDPPDDRV